MLYEVITGAHDIPLQEIDIRVKKVEIPDEHVVLLHARTPRTRRLRFLAGQEAYPVFTRKQATDVSYIVCAERLLDKRDT